MFQFIKSPNFDHRPKDICINLIVIHHTNMPTCKLAIERLCNSSSKVSCHFVIEKNGNIYQLVEVADRAWHAGISYWRGETALNNTSIGIELDNAGDEIYPLIQLQQLIVLCKYLTEKFSIEPRNIVGHSDVSPARKDDPNHFFDWQYLAKGGVGVYPEIQQKENSLIFAFGDFGNKVLSLQRKLATWGYELEPSGKFDLQTEIVVKAFKRHYCANSYLDKSEMIWDIESDKKLNILLEKVHGKN